MLILTHDGPGFRSRLQERADALAQAEQLQRGPRYSRVVTLESTRAAHPSRRFFVVCYPNSEE